MVHIGNQVLGKGGKVATPVHRFGFFSRSLNSHFFWVSGSDWM